MHFSTLYPEYRWVMLMSANPGKCGRKNPHRDNNSQIPLSVQITLKFLYRFTLTEFPAELIMNPNFQDLTPGGQSLFKTLCRKSPEANTTPQEAVAAEAASPTAAPAHPAFLRQKSKMRNLKVPAI